MKMKPYDGTCPICHQQVEAGGSFTDDKFIDNRNYFCVCHCCCCVPRQLDINGDRHYHPGFLNTVEELMIYGFDKISATLSLKAVKAAISKSGLDTKCDLVPLKIEPPIVSQHDNQVARIESGVNLSCGKCGKVCTSTSGLTLHKKRCNG